MYKIKNNGLKIERFLNCEYLHLNDDNEIFVDICREQMLQIWSIIAIAELIYTLKTTKVRRKKSDL